MRFPTEKVYNTYLIETSDYESLKSDISEFAISLGFDKNLVYTNNHPDIIYIEDVSRLEVKELKNNVVDTSYLTPKVSDKKIYIIFDASVLSGLCQNVLLKTLEDAPEHNIFILVTTNMNRIYDTIKSRSFKIYDKNDFDYKSLLEQEDFDDMIMYLGNLKYNKDSDILLFAKRYEYNEIGFRNFIRINRFLIRDAMIYKKTLDKKLITIKEKEEQIISIANSLEFIDFNRLSERLDLLSKTKGLQIDKKVAVYNFYMGDEKIIWKSVLG